MSEKPDKLKPTLIGAGFFFVGYLAAIFGHDPSELVENEVLSGILSYGGVTAICIGLVFFIVVPYIPQRGNR